MTKCKVDRWVQMWTCRSKKRVYVRKINSGERLNGKCVLRTHKHNWGLLWCEVFSGKENDIWFKSRESWNKNYIIWFWKDRKMFDRNLSLFFWVRNPCPHAMNKQRFQASDSRQAAKQISRKIYVVVGFSINISMVLSLILWRQRVQAHLA